MYSLEAAKYVIIILDVLKYLFCLMIESRQFKKNSFLLTLF